MQLEEGAVEEAFLFGGEIAPGFVGEDGEHIDALAGAEDVDLGGLALLGGSAELHDGGHVDGLHQSLEAHWRRVFHARVGGADGGVDAVCGGVECELGLRHLLSGWRRGSVGVVVQIFR